MKDLLAYWYECGSCEAQMIVTPRGDAPQPLPDNDDWEDPGNVDCPVCDGRMEWGGSDPVEGFFESTYGWFTLEREAARKAQGEAR